jgi:hypothetical protein
MGLFVVFGDYSLSARFASPTLAQYCQVEWNLYGNDGNYYRCYTCPDGKSIVTCTDEYSGGVGCGTHQTTSCDATGTFTPSICNCSRTTEACGTYGCAPYEMPTITRCSNVHNQPCGDTVVTCSRSSQCEVSPGIAPSPTGSPSIPIPIITPRVTPSPLPQWKIEAVQVIMEILRLFQKLMQIIISAP